MNSKAEKGCLVIHGLTGTPVIMKSFIDELLRAGFEVNAPLLPGHGTNVDDLARVRWSDWWDAVLDAYHDLQRITRKVGCVGLSLGSLLALNLAAEMRWGVRSVVAAGTPLVLSRLTEYLAYPLVGYTPLRWIYRFNKKDWVKSVADATGREFYIRHSYDKIPIHSVLELFKLKKIVRKRLSGITSPVLIVHGKEDEVAPIRNVGIIKRSIGSNMVDTLILKNSRHVVSLDFDREAAAKAVVAFLNRFS